jgi:hypothetical protein
VISLRLTIGFAKAIKLSILVQKEMSEGGYKIRNQAAVIL